MATLVINCPECEKEIKAPEEAVGKKIRCKGCEHIFVVAKPKTKATAAKAGKAAPAAPEKAAKPAKAAAKPTKAVDEDESETPYGLQGFTESNRCPNCANAMEDEKAKLCLHCGYNTATRTQARKRKVKEVTGGDRFLWLLPGFGAVFFIICILGYCAIHHWVLPPMLFDEWDKFYAETNSRMETISKLEGYLWLEVLFHPAIELWLVIMALFMTFYSGKFAIRRLLIDNKPPEIELK